MSEINWQQFSTIARKAERNRAAARLARERSRKSAPDTKQVLAKKFGVESEYIACSSLIYTRLGGDEIRLVTLKPGNYDEPIDCSLQIVSCALLPGDDSLSYETLSYAWGDSSLKSQTILLDLVRYPVTDSLYGALNHLRPVDAPRTLWIDALCINQTDEAERGLQVALMSSIYAESEATLIWLGFGDSRTERALAKFRSALSNGGSVDYASGPTETSVGEVKSLLSLCRRPWFERLWVVQEACLPRNRLEVCVGHLCLDFDLFARCIEHATQFTIEWNFTLDWVRLEHQVQALEHARHIWRCRSPNNRCTLLRQLWTLRGRRCMLPIDHVFGLLSICEDVDDRYIMIDYSLSASEIFARSVAHCIASEQNLKVLAATSAAGSYTDLPSWCPNWLLKAEIEGAPTFTSFVYGDEQGSKFSAALNTKPVWTMSKDWRALTLRGTVVATIRTGLSGLTSFNNLHSQDYEQYSEDVAVKTAWNVRSWYRGARSYQRQRDRFSYCGLDANDCDDSGDANQLIDEEAFWRTICAIPEGANRNRLGDEPQEGFNAWISLNRDDDTGSSLDKPRLPDLVDDYDAWCRCRDFLIAADAFSRGRKFIFAETDSGGDGAREADSTYGLAPQAAQDGDLIVVFAGAEVPFVVRRNIRNTLLLVGECYCFGFMSGQAFYQGGAGERMVDFILL